jgi:hypothetical protein
VSWWVTVAEGQPDGPIRTEDLLRGIAVGTVPRHALVCRVGEEEWRPLSDIQRFADALAATSLQKYGADVRTPYADAETVEPRAHRSSIPPPRARLDSHE